MALSITVNGGGTFSASMEEGPVSFTATLGAVPGPKGDTGATGPAGQNSVIAATTPIEYNAETQTVSIQGEPEFVSVRATEDTTTWLLSTGIRFPDLTEQTTAFVGEARKEYIIARNNTGSTIAKGKVVYLSGATGNKPTVALAIANSEATSARTIGIAVEAIANNAEGKVIISGAAENIDTSAFNAGDTVYLSSSVAGGLQTTLPAAPLHGVVIGIVTRSNPSVGSIEVAIQNYQELSELSDVNVSDKANNDGLFWEASSSTWRSKTIAEVLGYTPSSLALTSFSASAPISYNSGTGAFTFDSSGFLLKADNLSGLASVSTARSNLGLGSAATSSTSDFAAAVHTHTASQISDSTTAGRALLTAADAAAQRTSLDVYSKAQSDALVPAASTTVAGKVELATEAETVSGISTTLAVTPLGLQQAILTPETKQLTLIAQTSATSGTGSSASRLNNHAISIAAPTSVTGYATSYVAISNLHRGQRADASFDWSKRIEVQARIARDVVTPDTNSVFRFSVGKQVNTLQQGDITSSFKGIQLKVAGTGALLFLVANGSTLTTNTSSFTPSDRSAYDVRIVSDGSGNAELYVNDSLVASATNAPTSSISASTYRAIWIEAENVASLTNSRYLAYVSDINLTIGL